MSRKNTSHPFPVVLGWKAEDAWYFTLLLSNKCQMSTHNSYTYTHSHSKTFFYYNSKFPFRFDLFVWFNSLFLSIPQSNALIQSISIKSEPHRTGALLVQDSIVKTVILLLKRYSSFFPCVHFLPFLLIPPLYQISDPLNLLLIDPNGFPDQRRCLLLFFHSPMEVWCLFEL